MKALVALGKDLSKYAPATIEGILFYLPLTPEKKNLFQPRNRIVQPEDQLELADRLIDKYKLKNKHTNLKTMAALGKDLSRLIQIQPKESSYIFH